MKRILITGANSYIGDSLKKWLGYEANYYKVDVIDLKNDGWKEAEFTQYDTIFHVAGIAHADVGKASNKIEELYFKVNRDLTIEVAKKAKAEGVRQFIFMSSIIVYGDCNSIKKYKVITCKTQPIPSNFYGESKLQAENGLRQLQDEKFHIVILRPPMIYGKESKGNYALLSMMSCKLPVFPKINNQRSMLYIDNLCEFVKLMIDNDEYGVFFPQNAEYTKTSDIVKLIAANHKKKIWINKWLNPIVYILAYFPGKVGRLIIKAFGSITYDFKMSEYKENYRVVNFKESICLTEK